MDLGLAGKTVLVTGASAGIGKGMAAEFHREGCVVHMVSRSRENLDAAAAEIGGDPARLHVHAFDIADSASVNGIRDAVGVPDILVNNAGAIPAGDLQAMTEERWRAAWELKVFGYINMTRTFYAAMAERGHGGVVNVTGQVPTIRIRCVMRSLFARRCQEPRAARCGTSGKRGDAAGARRKATLRAAVRGPWTSSRRLADVPHRLRRRS